MQILQITRNNIDLLKTFLKNQLPLKFRYFNSRDITCIENHVITLLMLVDNTPIAYGHLDKDQTGNIWLGVCVLDEHQSNGYGKAIVKSLLDYAQNNTIVNKVVLTVDKDNINAIKLYEKFKFVIANDTNSYYKMELNLVRNNISLPVSFGEAFDKLSILYIKQSMITDSEKIRYIEYEYKSLFELLKPYFSESIQFHYNTLISINHTIWTLQDYFRNEPSDDIKNKLCTQIIFHNDRRFRVKHKIDSLISSQFKEQKGYSKKSLFILSHFGMGDNLTQIGLYRYLSTIYDRVTVVCKKQNVENMRMILGDDKSIDFYECLNENEISPMLGAPHEKLEYAIKDYDSLLSLGLHKHTVVDTSLIPFSFYIEANIDTSVFWEYYYMQTLPDAEQYYHLLGQMGIHNYVFIHNTCSSGEVFDFNCIEKCLGDSRDDILFLSVSSCAYEKDHKYYDIANKFVGLPLPYYKIIMTNATKIVVSDSSFFCMGLNLERSGDNCYYVNLHGNNYNYIYNKFHFGENNCRPIFKHLFDAIKPINSEYNKAYYSKVTKSLIYFRIKSKTVSNNMVLLHCDTLDDTISHELYLLYDSSLNAIVFASPENITSDNNDLHGTCANDFGFLDTTTFNGLPILGNAYIPELCKYILQYTNIESFEKISAATTWILEKYNSDVFKNYYWPIQNSGKAIAQVHYVSFASSNLSETLQRNLHQARNCGFFSSVHGFSETNIPEFVGKHKDFFESNKRLYGYAIWKPYIIKKVLDTIQEGEFLLYLDAGSSINPTSFCRFNEYIQMCKESTFKNMVMQIVVKEDYLPKYTFSELEWTKGDVLDQFQLSEEQKIAPQYLSGFWLLQKTPETIQLVDKWLSYTENYAFFDDSVGKLPNSEKFIEHRHDQSVFSCLLKSHGTLAIPNEYDISEKSWHNPFWATRIK